MARAKERYGFLLRNKAQSTAGKSSETMTAEAAVFLAAAAYFGFATKVICPVAASSIPETPVMSVSGSPFSRVRPRAVAISPSFIVFGDARDQPRRFSSTH